MPAKKFEKIELLRALTTIKNDRMFKIIVKYLNEDGINTIGEAFWNILYNNKVKFSPRQRTNVKKLLSKDKNTVYYITNKKRNSRKRKKKIIQKGGFIGALLAAVIPLIASSLISKYAK